MIRDPSDGSVREAPKPEEPAPRAPLFVSIEASLIAGKVKPERISEQWVYQRAWNDGIDFALAQINRLEKRGVLHADGGNDDRRTASELPDRAGS